jgi:hypothetical protein
MILLHSFTAAFAPQVSFKIWRFTVLLIVQIPMQVSSPLQFFFPLAAMVGYGWVLLVS